MQSKEWKHTDSLVKKKFQTQLTLKKDMLTVIWDMGRSISVDYFVKDF